MKKFQKTAAMLLALMLLLCSCGRVATAPNKPEDTVSSSNEKPLGQIKIGTLGSAGYIPGNTVIVSVISNDRHTSWSDEDAPTLEKVCRDMRIATDWLEEQCAVRGVKAKFYYDWYEDSDLVYYASFEDDLVEEFGSFYDEQKEYIIKNIDSAYLREKYDAYNIIYFFHFNTPYSNEVNTWSITCISSCCYDYELVSNFVRFDYADMTPASYAHEIMHCFGAYDFYYERWYPDGTVPQEFVNHCFETDCSDIMYTVNAGDEITVEFSDLDAYYLGLLESCDLVKKWSLPISQHINRAFLTENE